MATRSFRYSSPPIPDDARRRVESTLSLPVPRRVPDEQLATLPRWLAAWTIERVREYDAALAGEIVAMNSDGECRCVSPEAMTVDDLLDAERYWRYIEHIILRGNEQREMEMEVLRDIEALG